MIRDLIQTLTDGLLLAFLTLAPVVVPALLVTGVIGADAAVAWAVSWLITLCLIISEGV